MAGNLPVGKKKEDNKILPFMKKSVMFLVLLLIPISVSAGIFGLNIPPGVAPGVVCFLTGCNMTGDMYFNNNTIYDANFINATFSGSINASDIVDPVWVERGGDTMTGGLNMSGNNINNVLNFYATLVNATNIITNTITSNDWSNIDGTNDIVSLPSLSITESQISDLTHVVEDIWVNESGDSMTGNLNMTGNNISDVYRLGFDNNQSYFRLHTNGTNTTLQLWVNGILQQDWGASTTIYQEATFLDSIFGDGSTLLNVCLPTGLTVNNVPCNATSVFNTDEIWINNLEGNATFNESKLNDTINNILNSTHSVGAGPYLYNVNDGNKTNIYINETVLISTIDNRTGIFELNFTVNVIGGIGNNASEFDFPRLSDILEVIVMPTTSTNRYRSHMNGSITGTIVDRDRIPHIGEWNVAHRGSIIQGETISAYITEATIDELFIINLKYRQ